MQARSNGRAYISQAIMGKIKVRRADEDLRELPSYSITEAAYYLGIPPSTLKTWVRGYKRRIITGVYRQYPGMIRAADPRRKLLSFYNLCEAHILDAARRRDIPTQRLRIAVEYTYEQLPGTHPLLTHEFQTAGRRIFLRGLQRDPVEASRYGQAISLKLAPTLKKFLKTLVRDPDDPRRMPIELRPIRRTSVRVSPVAINPKICSGKPIVRGTDVLASILRQRAGAGEPLSELARDYGLEITQIKRVVQYLKTAKYLRKAA